MSPIKRNSFYKELETDDLLLRVSLSCLVASWSVVLECTTLDSFDLRVLDVFKDLLRMFVGGELNESKVELFEERPKQIRVIFCLH
jgi:hypothetical protein